MSGAFSPLPPFTLQQAEDALHRIPANIARNEWAAIAASLRGEFGDVAFDAFDRWSATVDNYRPADIRDTWRSCGKRACSIATLIFHAKKTWMDGTTTPPTDTQRASANRT